MNQVQRGYQRDREIVALVAEHGALTAEQVAGLMFQGRAALRKAQQRLKKLVDAERLSRCRLDLEYVYYQGRRPGQMDHLIAVNWAHLWVRTRLRQWERLARWEVEPDYGRIRPDALAVAENRFTGEWECWLVEVDRSTNAWRKAAAYAEFYESGGYLAAWWANNARRFPTVLCVVSSGKRAETVKRAIAADNEPGLRFEVVILDALVKEARAGVRAAGRGGDSVRLPAGLHRRGGRASADSESHEAVDTAAGGKHDGDEG